MENISVNIEKGETLAHYAEKMSKMCKEGLIDVEDAIMIVCVNYPQTKDLWALDVE